MPIVIQASALNRLFTPSWMVASVQCGGRTAEVSAPVALSISRVMQPSPPVGAHACVLLHVQHGLANSAAPRNIL